MWYLLVVIAVAVLRLRLWLMVLCDNVRQGRMISLFGLRGMMPFYLYILATFVVSKFLMPDYVSTPSSMRAIIQPLLFVQAFY